MSSNLFFDFTVNKSDNSVLVTREFAGDLSLVWDAWTTPELIDQWWAPKPYRAVTKSMDFREGGTWLYAMISPADEAHCCRADYKEITPQKLCTWIDAFTDDNGVINDGKPRSDWRIEFTGQGETTKVIIHIRHETLEDLETIIAMGFKEGFTMGMQNLDELLISITANNS